MFVCSIKRGMHFNDVNFSEHSFANLDITVSVEAVICRAIELMPQQILVCVCVCVPRSMDMYA